VITNILVLVSKLAAEIHQTKPFSSRQEEAMLNLARTHEFLNQRAAEFFKRFHLTPTQYNMLRILRGAGPEGVTCSQACERMITPDPDVTRLLDRMENQGWIRRERSQQDRRVVISRITTRGLKLTNQIDAPLQELLQELFATVDDRRLQALIETLESLRSSPTQNSTPEGEL
jgi:DNA-binding MarR family transcriptional regulator